MELDDVTVVKIRELALRQAFLHKHQEPHWFHRAYCDLAHAADVLLSFKAREVPDAELRERSPKGDEGAASIVHPPAVAAPLNEWGLTEEEMEAMRALYQKKAMKLGMYYDDEAIAAVYLAGRHSV